MAKTQRTQQPHGYDSSLKDLIEQQAPAVLPVLLPGVVYERTLNVDMVRSTMRGDKVYKVTYQAEEHILHLEFESGADSEMTSRLLAYNSTLYRDHRLPVISMIIYPFRVKMAESPLRIVSKLRELLTFHFFTLPLFCLDAEQFVRERCVSMYPLLPTMQGANAALIKQAMDELAMHYREDEITLSQQLVWMQLLLARTDTISPEEKNKIQEQLSMYDRLWEDNPKVKKTLAQGKAEGEITTLQRTLVHIVSLRFPVLTELVQERVKQLNKAEELDQLVEQAVMAPDEATARKMLLGPPAV
ncbi:MAG TPA: hypothetical protein VKY19_15070 [Ktedonosporobacter sp.]|jgi:hypothetical protein|nr:hypothetical protein [Ktedonosporobacter sp.]